MTDTDRDVRISTYRRKAGEIRARAEQMQFGEEKKASLKVADGYDAMVARLGQPKGSFKRA